jgi:hypothetical protein
VESKSDAPAGILSQHLRVEILEPRLEFMQLLGCVDSGDGGLCDYCNYQTGPFTLDLIAC